MFVKTRNLKWLCCTLFFFPPLFSVIWITKIHVIQFNVLFFSPLSIFFFFIFMFETVSNEVFSISSLPSFFFFFYASRLKYFTFLTIPHYYYDNIFVFFVYFNIYFYIFLTMRKKKSFHGKSCLRSHRLSLKSLSCYQYVYFLKFFFHSFL